MIVAVPCRTMPCRVVIVAVVAVIAVNEMLPTWIQRTLLAARTASTTNKSNKVRVTDAFSQMLAIVLELLFLYERVQHHATNFMKNEKG